MLTLRNHQQSNLQCLFGNTTTNTGLRKNNHQNIINTNTKKPQQFTTVQMNGQDGKPKYLPLKMSLAQSKKVQNDQSFTPGNKSIANRYHQMNKAAASSFMKMNDQESKNMNCSLSIDIKFRQDMIKDRGNVLGGAQAIKKTQVNTDTVTNAHSFEVSGTIGCLIVDNYQDESFGSNGQASTTRQGNTQSKFSRNSSKLMAVPQKLEGKDYDMDIIPVQYIQKYGFGQKIIVEDLPYSLNDLEPVIDISIIKFHRELQEKYVKELNWLLSQVHEADYDKQNDKLKELEQKIQFYWGGNINYEIFWQSLAPTTENGGVIPTDDSDLGIAISKAFGSVDGFIVDFIAYSVCMKKKGMAWLAYDKKTGELEIIQTDHHQIMSQTQDQFVPLLTINIWEKLFFDQKSEKNLEKLRPRYGDIISKLINWEKVAEKFAVQKKNHQLKKLNKYN